MIRGCKEAIFEEYKELDESHDGYNLQRMAEESGKYDIRDEFEAAWTNWEKLVHFLYPRAWLDAPFSDMRDRMAMRGKLQESLAWTEPLHNERPDWRIWRERAGDVEIDETESAIHLDNICRSLRGFVGWKPDKTAVQTQASVEI